jgi:phosphoglycolate phosphatase
MADNRGIIFDFDGVIADTFELCRGLTREFDGIDFSPEDYKTFFDGNIYHTGPQFDMVSFKDPVIKRKLQEAYALRVMELLPIAGLPDVIHRAAELAPLHVVTSGETASIARFLHTHGLGHRFGKVLGYDVEHSKIKKFELLGAHGSDAGQHVYVTDTLGDLHEAQKAGLKAIAVSWGFHDTERLKRGKSDVIVHTPEELFAALQSLFARPA